VLPADADSLAHDRVKQLFMAVVDLPDAAAQRAALRVRGADEVTFAEVMRLLAHDVAQLPLGVDLLAAMKASGLASPPRELRLALEVSAQGHAGELPWAQQLARLTSELPPARP